MRRDDQIAAAITGTFALVLTLPDGVFIYTVLFPTYTPVLPWTAWVFSILANAIGGGIGIWAVMTRPRIGALWYLGWSIVLMVQLIVMGRGALMIAAGLPAVILLIAAFFGWRASRQPSKADERATAGSLRNDS